MEIRNASLRNFLAGVRIMNEQHLNNLLRNVPNYLGSFAADELNEVKITENPTLLVVNYDERSDKGSHWIGVAIFLKDVYICDSLGGIAPTKRLSQGWINFLYLLSRSRNLIITKQLQPIDSAFCGLYVATFVKELSRNTFEDFLRLFTEDLRKNDVIVQFLYKQSTIRKINGKASVHAKSLSNNQ